MTFMISGSNVRFLVFLLRPSDPAPPPPHFLYGAAVLRRFAGFRFFVKLHHLSSSLARANSTHITCAAPVLARRPSHARVSRTLAYAMATTPRPSATAAPAGVRPRGFTANVRGQRGVSGASVVLRPGSRAAHGRGGMARCASQPSHLEADFPMEPRHVAPRLYVAQVMNENVVSLHADNSLRDALELFLARRVSGTPVVDDDDGLVGVISMTDIMWVESTEAMEVLDFPFYPKATKGDDGLGSVGMTGADGRRVMLTGLGKAEASDLLSLKVSGRMSKKVICIEPQTLLSEAAALMIDKKINRLPVVDPNSRNNLCPNGKVIGIITRLDVMRCLAAVWL